MPYRNAMFLIADDWSPIARCYGNAVIKLPRIDAFAAANVVFDWAFCTTPSCAASRAVILTGQHSHTHGQYGHCHSIHGFRTHEHLRSLPKILGERGFATACVGKKHVAPASVYPFAYEPEVDLRNGNDLAECARTFLRESSDQPFYLHVGFADPHRSTQGFGNECAYRGVPEVRYDPADVVVPGFLPDIDAVRRDLADYYQALSRFDYGVGRLLEVLAESGRAEETLVIVTTDHGMPFPGAKASFFESGHHCPFLIRAPGLSSGGTHNQALINWTNICPTILDWCTGEVPDDLPERSLLPILGTPEPEGWDETCYSHSFHEVIDYNPYRVLRGRRYKYVRHLAPTLIPPLPTDIFRSPTWTGIRERKIEMLGERPLSALLQRAPEELYDLESDPQEARNLMAEPALQETVREMRQRLYAFRQATKDPWLEVDFQEGRSEDVAVS